jgi:DNA-binding SARP family transcriptional activator/tetratricopeptide (TPR) repeat protein
MNAGLPALGQPVASGSCLRFRLLGPPIAAWNETVLAISRRLVRALLYRLASDPEPVTRGHLRLLFWPDVPESVARRNLSHLLTHLRRALPEPEMLVATGDEVWLEPCQIRCDVLELKRAGFEPATDAPHLRHAASLYRGPFLDGFDLPTCPEFEHWCLVERNALEHQYLRVLERLVERCTSAGEVSQAIQYARQYLETDALSETIHRRLIQLFAASGDRHLALQQFERCSSILESDLGVRPLPETRAVYQAVLGGQRRFPEAPSPLRPPRLPDSDVPLLGREEELRTLEAAFQGLEAQQGRVLLISGEPGIGKSRLVHEFAKRHQGQARLLYGCGHAGEQAIPYQPIVGILRTILGLTEEETGRPTAMVSTERPLPDFVEPVWLSEASRLLPEMHVIYPDLPSPLPQEPESARTRLFDALCHVVLAYAMARGPALLCLDDLQWTDATTKAWVVHIGRFLTSGGYPLLILGTFRTEEAGDVLHLRHALVRAGVLAELELAGLEECAVLALLRHLVGQRSGDEMLARRLHRATGGNPFYLIETVRKLIEEGTLETHFQEAMHFTLPQTVREAVQARLQRLSPVARQVLEAGAVLGESFGLELLQLTAGRSQAETMSAADELAARILLVETPQEYRFIHEIIRQHVEESLSPIRRRLLHRRAGRAYQRLNPDAFPALAYHFEWGGEPAKALRYHELAARQAQTLFAWRMAEFHHGQMLDLLARIDPGYDRPDLVRQRGEVLAEKANALHLQGRAAARDADLDALHDLGEASGDDQVRLLAVLNHLRYLNLDGAYAQAIAVAERGLALLESSPTLAWEADQAGVARARLLAQLGLAYDSLGKPLEALGVLEQAWSLCGEDTDSEACGRILHNLGYVHHHLGEYARALEYQQQAYAYHAEASDYHRMAWDLVDIGTLHKHLGDLAQATRFLGEGLELARRVGSEQAQAYGLAQRGSLDLHQGDYAAAVTHYQEAAAMQPASHSEQSLAIPEAGLGLALYHLGDYAQSRHWLERALSGARASGHRRCTAEILVELGMLDTAEGRLPLAQQHLEEGLALARDCQSCECLAAGQAVRAHLARLSGDPTRALELADEAVRTARQIRLTCCEMWGEFEAGLARLALGEPSAALEHTGRAAVLAPQAGQDWIGGEEAYRAHARVLRALAQDEAADHYERCAREAVQAKAGRIPDPTQRDHYLAKFHQSPTVNL